jgi:uncharacterized membrane protein YphA (DoxX/SURF4 family)
MLTLIETWNRVYYMLATGLTRLDGLASLGLRLYLAPVMLSAGYMKLTSDNWFPAIQEAFPFPFDVMPAGLAWFVAAWTEFVGGILLALGLGVRLIAIPLMVTMWVAAISVHWDNGWPAIAPSSPSPVCIEGSEASQQTNAFVRFINCYNVNDRTLGAAERLAKGKEIMQEHGRWSWLNQNGSFAKLNNGIEFAATYFLMLFALLILGGGRLFSLDYWLGVYVDRHL